MDQIKLVLQNQYGLGTGIEIKKIDAGFLSENYAVVDGNRAFFLKGYVKGIERVREVHKVKEHFFSHGIPVLLPIKNSAGNTLFVVNEKVYGLFPFVSGIHHNRQYISNEIAVKIARLIARMHAVAQKFPLEITAKEKLWNDSDAIKNIDELLGRVSSITHKSDFDERVLCVLNLKKKLILENPLSPDSFRGDINLLLHGDFHEQNIFFDKQGEVMYVFDFGETKMGIRARELWRSAEFMFLNGVFEDKNIEQVILYLRAYNAENPISKDELMRGFLVYFKMLIHSTWVETEHYIKGNTRVDHFLEKGTLEYLAKHKEEFLDRIIKGVYNNFLV